MIHYINANDNTDQVYWFPLRVSYDRSIAVARELEGMGIPPYDGEKEGEDECYFLPRKTITVHFDENDREFYYDETAEPTINADGKEEKKRKRIGQHKYFTISDHSQITPEDTKNNMKFKIVSKPLLSNLIFIRTTKSRLQELRHDNPTMSAVNFMSYISHSDLTGNMSTIERNSLRRIITLTHRDIHDFHAIISEYNRDVTILDFDKLKSHFGKRIRIINGPLAGQEGIVRRIKGNKKIHFEIGDLLTIQVDYIPNRMYELVDEPV